MPKLTRKDKNLQLSKLNAPKNILKDFTKKHMKKIIAHESILYFIAISCTKNAQTDTDRHWHRRGYAREKIFCREHAIF